MTVLPVPVVSEVTRWSERHLLGSLTPDITPVLFVRDRTLEQMRTKVQPVNKGCRVIARTEARTHGFRVKIVQVCVENFAWSNVNRTSHGVTGGCNVIELCEGID